MPRTKLIEKIKKADAAYSSFCWIGQTNPDSPTGALEVWVDNIHPGNLWMSFITHQMVLVVLLVQDMHLD